MSSARQLCHISIIWGATVGLCVGVVDLLVHEYIQQGLMRLAAHTLADAAWTYLAAAVLGWAGAMVIRVVGGPIAKRLGAFGAHVLGLGMFLACSLPVWAWSFLHDTWVYPPKREFIIAGFGILCLAHIPVYYLLIRPVARKRLADRHGRGLSVTAWIGFGVVAVSVVASGAASRLADPGHPRPNVLIIVMDTVRADRLSCYGCPRKTTPEIDAFAREGIRFTHFYSTSSWTVPSHASLFTGLFPARHQATQEKWTLANRFTTLAEILLDGGYQTWGTSTNPFVGAYANLAQGFERFDEPWHTEIKWYYAEPDRHANNVAFGRFLRRSDRGRPFFAFINYMDAHYPYAPKEPHLSRFLKPGTDPAAALAIGRRNPFRHYIDGPYPREEIAICSDLYDGEVAGVSEAVGDLLQMLREDGRYDETLIMLTSDHGESFGENGLIDHVFGLYNTTVAVPLIVRLPGGKRPGEVVDRNGQLVDLFPTVLRAAGVDDAGISHHGEDLLCETPPFSRKAIFSEYYFPVQVLGRYSRKDFEEHGDKLAPFLRRLRAVQSGGASADLVLERPA